MEVLIHTSSKELIRLVTTKCPFHHKFWQRGPFSQGVKHNKNLDLTITCRNKFRCRTLVAMSPNNSKESGYTWNRQEPIPLNVYKPTIVLVGRFWGLWSAPETKAAKNKTTIKMEDENTSKTNKITKQSRPQSPFSRRLLRLFQGSPPHPTYRPGLCTLERWKRL